MIIKTRLSESDFIYVTFVLFFAKPIMRIVYTVMSIALLLAIMSAVTPSAIIGDFSVSRLIFPAFVVAFLPVVTYFTAKKNYSSNKRIDETIEYEFEKDYLSIQGQSFNSQMTWDKIYKVSETKKWVFIWQTKYLANAIRKIDIPGAELTELKQILTSQNVKNNIG